MLFCLCFAAKEGKGRKMARCLILITMLCGTGCRHYYYQVSNPVEVMVSNENDIALKVIDRRRNTRTGVELFIHIPSQTMEEYVSSRTRMIVLSVSRSPSKSLRAEMSSVPDREHMVISDRHLSFRWEEMSYEEAVGRGMWFVSDSPDLRHRRIYGEFNDYVVVPYEVGGITYYIHFYPRTLRSRLEWH